MIELFIQALGIAAPGLADWPQARAVLAGHMAWANAELPPYQPALLPPNERRRVTPSVKQAFRAAEDAVSRYTGAVDQLAAVFASSDGDLGIIHRISLALTETARAVSPTDFHNSVHNAAAGYWSIATGSRLPSTTISAYDDSFAAGLLEAALLATASGHDTLLVAYDVPGPPLLQAARPFIGAAGVAVILSPSSEPQTLARLRLSLGVGAVSTMPDLALDALRLGNPALRALPLLRALALGDPAVIGLALPSNQGLRVEITPP
jgi:hypothetical protein